MNRNYLAADYVQRGLRAISGVAVAVLLGCTGGANVGQPDAGRVVAVSNAGFERPVNLARDAAEGWSCEMHSDAASFRCSVDASVSFNSLQSLLIEQLKPEPWGYATQVVDAAGYIGMRMVLSADVRTEGATGNGGGIFYTLEGAAGNSIHGQRLLSGTGDWQNISLEFMVPEKTSGIRIAALLEGPGKLWIDNVSLRAFP